MAPVAKRLVRWAPLSCTALRWIPPFALSVLSGTGFLVLELGGVSATTEESDFANPFGVAGDTSPVFAPTTPPAAAGEAPRPPAAPAPRAEDDPAERAAAVPEPPTTLAERICESVHPYRWPPCSDGAAVPLGIVAIGAATLFGALDWRHQRLRAAAARDG